MIEQAQQILLDALKASLFETTFSYSDDTEWDAVIKEAKSQAVMGLISPVIPVHDESSDQGKVFYMRLLHEQDKLLNLFDEHSIPCVILKGCAAAIYYPKPFLRAMGDVDFLVRRNQFEEAMKLMESNGYVYSHGKNDDGSLAFNSRHIGYYKNGIEFELHHHFSSTGFNMDDILEKSIDKREYRELNGHSFPVLPKVENGLVLLGHLYQHLKKDELGLRQIIDWEMYVHSALNEDRCKKEFASIAKELGLLDLAINVTLMCEKHLGLTKTIKRNVSATEEIADELLDNLLTSGNFGSKQLTLSEYSGERIRAVTGTIKSKGLFLYFQDNGLETWKLCKKYPVLKPLAFIYGFFRFCIRGILGVLKTGKFKQQISYVRKKKHYDKELGIRKKEERSK